MNLALELTRRLLQACLLFLLTAVSAAPADAPANETHARDVIEKALHDKNPDSRKQAAVALSLGGAREPFVSMLQSLVDDKDVETRLAAVSSLAEFKTPQTTATLRKMLEDDVPEVSFAAAKALFTENDPEGKQATKIVSRAVGHATNFGMFFRVPLSWIKSRASLHAWLRGDPVRDN